MSKESKYSSLGADVPDTKRFLDLLLKERGNKVKKVKLKRYQYLTRAGEIEKHLYVVESGALRAIYLTAEEEHSIRFGYTGSIINALPSYFTGRPAELYIQALRATVVQAIPKSVIYSHIDEHKERQVQYRSLLEQLAVQQMERELDLLTASPRERIKRVAARSPQVFQEIPAKYIASYLRMSPETLSRLQKELNS